MTKKWKRKPRAEEKFKNYRYEDLFLCCSCKDWASWFHYTKGADIIGFNTDDTYEYLNDDMDRGGREWACNNCIYDLLYENGLIIIRDEFGKNILQ